METSEAHRTAETVFRMERARLIAGLARIVRDVGRAEELAQDALVVALDRWPTSGIPDNPAAWLMATAKRRAIDALRRARMMERKHDEIGRDLELEQDSTIEAIEASMDDDIGDERLSLIFTACHPVLSTDARAALTLRLIGGLTTDEIARAFLSSETTIAQRIVRAKKSLGGAGIAYEVPRGAERDARLASVLAACHARARRFEDTDWRMIAGLYDRLLTVLPSPVVGLNRSVAHAMAFGPEHGLELLDALEEEPALKGYAPMAAARGDFLLRAGRPAEARAAFERAAVLAGNASERAFLMRRAEQCAAC